MTLVNGIDVSKHQGTINWDAVKASGIKFAIIRAGYGKNNIDPQFKRNISECNRLGIPCGVYWFSYALTEQDAINEAKACLEAVKPYKLEYPIFFDLEYDTANYLKKQGITLTKAMATKHAKAFLSTIEAAGYYAANYANPDYLSRFFDSSVLNVYDLWLANFKSDADLTKPPRTCGIWQHSSTGRVSGITGNVDLDVAYIDYPTIIKKNGLNGFSKQSETKWVKDATGWKYGDYKSKWLEDKGYWYWFNATGYAVTGLNQINGKLYYFMTASDAKATGKPECSCLNP